MRRLRAWYSAWMPAGDTPPSMRPTRSREANRLVTSGVARPATFSNTMAGWRFCAASAQTSAVGSSVGGHGLAHGQDVVGYAARYAARKVWKSCEVSSNPA